MYKGMEKKYLFITKTLPLEKWYIRWFRKDSKIQKLNRTTIRSVVAHSSSHAVWLLRRMGYDVTNDYLECWSEPLQTK